MPKRFYTVKEAAKILDFSTNTLYKYLDEGKIKTIRLGRGRFKIPASELAPYLSAPQSPSLAISGVGTAEVAIQTPILRVSFSKIDISGISSPSIFDWFVATLAIFLGLSYFLFPIYTLDVNFAPYLTVFKLININLIFLGIILLSGDILAAERRYWHTLIHVFLGILFGISAIIFLRTGYLTGLIGDGAIALILLTTAKFKIDDRLRFLALINIFAFFSGVAFLIKPSEVGIVPLSLWVEGHKFFFAVFWFLVYFLIARESLHAIRGQIERGTIVLSISVAAGALVFASAGFSAGYWDKAINSIILASFVVVFPFWHKFDLAKVISKKGFLIGFFWLLGTLLVGTFLIFYLKSYFEKNAQIQLKTQANSASEMVESFIERDSKAVLNFSQDSRIKGGDLSKTLRELYLSSGTTLRRLIVTDAKGQILAAYPEDPSLVKGDVSSEGGFVELKGGKKVSLATSPTVSIFAPIETDGKFLGAVVGLVDLRELDSRLQEASLARKISFIIVDDKRKYLVHPDEKLVGSQAKEGEGISLAADGKSGVGEAYDSSSKLSFEAYKPIASLGWGISIQRPFSDILMNYSVVGFVIFILIALSSMGSQLVVAYMRRK